MSGDPAEKANLSVSVDWKVLRQKRKVKMRELRDKVNQGIL